MSRSVSLLKSLLPQLYEDLGERSVDDKYLANHIVEALCDDVSAQFQSTLVTFKKIFNARLAHARLHSELWCLVWSWLPVQQDLINVTHVCHTWRAIALDHASFWKNVGFFTTVHERGSSCDDDICDCHEATDWQQWDDDGNPQPMHNLQKVETVLGRSKGVALKMDVGIYPVFSDRSLAVELAEIVRPHAHCIDSLLCVLGDVSFFVDFMQEVKEFPSLQVLRMQRITYHEDEHNSWPMAKLQLEHLVVPRLRKFQSYANFWWEISRTLEARGSWTALEHLDCNFTDARSFYDCLRTCSNLVFLNAELANYAPRRLPPAPPEDIAELVPRLRDLTLERMTPLWESVVRPIIRRSSLRDLTLGYMEFDANSLFNSMRHLEGGVQLSILSGLTLQVGDNVQLKATDERSRSRCLDVFSGIHGMPPTFITLSHLWTHVNVSHLCRIGLSWTLRAVLLDRQIDAPGISSIQLVVKHSDTGPQPTIGELMARNDASVAGRPRFPNLAVLHITTSKPDCAQKLLAKSVKDIAATLSDRECTIDLVGVELLEQA